MLFILLLFQTDEPNLLSQAREAYLAGDYQAVMDQLAPALFGPDAAINILAADAAFALNEPAQLNQAEKLYLHALYEVENNPYPDHCYFRLAQIYFGRGSIDDAKLYFGQIYKKFPKSQYLAQAVSELAAINESEGHYKKSIEWAKILLESNPSAQERLAYESVTPLIGEVSKEELIRLYSTHTKQIQRNPPLAEHYALAFSKLQEWGRARELSLRIWNLFPNWNQAKGLVHNLIGWEREQGYVLAARFLIAQMLNEEINNQERAALYLHLVQMIEKGEINEDGDPKIPPYSEMTAFIIKHHEDEAIRGHYHFKDALFQSYFKDDLQALNTLRDVSNDNQTGAFSGLYRNQYHAYLHKTIRESSDPELVHIFKENRAYFQNNLDTNYSEIMVSGLRREKDYKGALDLYEMAWNTKMSQSGFQLAFEKILTESLHFFDVLREDQILRKRIPHYEQQYSNNGKYLDQFRFIKTKYEARTNGPGQLLQDLNPTSLPRQTEFDVRRLEFLSVLALEQAQNALGDELHNRILSSPAIQGFPDLQRWIEAHRADRAFQQGNYRKARAAYTAIRENLNFDFEDRMWAQLQLARLFELEGSPKTAIRLYGQVIHAELNQAPWLAMFAGRRIEALANLRKQKNYAEALNIEQL